MRMCVCVFVCVCFSVCLFLLCVSVFDVRNVIAINPPPTFTFTPSNLITTQSSQNHPPPDVEDPRRSLNKSYADSQDDDEDRVPLV